MSMCTLNSAISDTSRFLLHQRIQLIGSFACRKQSIILDNIYINYIKTGDALHKFSTRIFTLKS